MTGWNADVGSTGHGARGDVTLVDGSTFVVSDRAGDVECGTDGLYLLDTRVLSLFRLTIDGQRVQPLSTVPTNPYSCRFVGRVLHPGGPADTPLVVVRSRSIGNGLTDMLQVRNYGVAPLRAVVDLEVGVDFASLFEVKANRNIPTTLAPCRVHQEGTALSVRDPASDIRWETQVRTTVAGTARPGGITWEVQLEPGGQWSTCLEVTFRLEDRVFPLTHTCGADETQPGASPRGGAWRATRLVVDCDDRSIPRTLDRSHEDLGTLRILDPTHVDRMVVAAGAPWYMTLFGRDALLTAAMALPHGPELALGVLHSLADLQGERVDPVTEEEPGRILHEVRYDRTTMRTLGGHNAYYGSVDATPLFVMLLGELARWGVPAPALEPLLGPADRAMRWIDEFGDRDGDGFVEYERASPYGLVNQAWKDSWDAVRFHDGTLAEPPLAMAEVQAYVHGAFEARAVLHDVFGEPGPAARLRERAAQLRRRFDEAFWLDERGWYALALDAAKRPVDALASNIGHCLWTGIVDGHRARAMASLLTDERLSSGFGVRTLATSTGGYNPVSYHCGAVWPHDTAIAVAGMVRAGCPQEAASVARAFFDAAAAYDGRLPELFAGFDRHEFATPVTYPAACSPQAWASAAPLLVLRSLLGLEPDIPSGTVRVDPMTVEGIGRLSVSGIRIAGCRVTVAAGPDGVRLDGLDGAGVRTVTGHATATHATTKGEDHAT